MKRAFLKARIPAGGSLTRYPELTTEAQAKAGP
jgi:hypothetical protein